MLSFLLYITSHCPPSISTSTNVSSILPQILPRHSLYKPSQVSQDALLSLRRTTTSHMPPSGNILALQGGFCMLSGKSLSGKWVLQFKPFSQCQVQLCQVPYPTPQSEGLSFFWSVLVNIPKFHHSSYHQQIISSILQRRTVINIRRSNHSHIVSSQHSAWNLGTSKLRVGVYSLYQAASCPLLLSVP